MPSDEPPQPPAFPGPGAAAAAGPGQPGPWGELVLELRKPLGSMGLISPVVRIDGYPVAASWGRNVIPAPAGLRRVGCASNYLWTYGHAELPVEVPAGGSTTAHYSGPMITFLAGRMGSTLQPRPGLPVLVSVLGLVGLILAILIVAAVVSAAGS